MRTYHVAALATLLAVALPAVATDGYVQSEADFRLITYGQNVQVQSFETAPVKSEGADGLSWSWGDVTFTCSGTKWCKSFSGVTQDFGVSDGQSAVFFSTPDVATFTFAQPIYAFSVDVWGLASMADTPFGNNMSSSLKLTYANGSHAYFEGYAWNGDLGAPSLFAGAWFASPVTSISFTGAVDDDGIIFDRLQYVTAPVPEPGTWALMALGLGAVALSRRRRD